MTAARGGEYEVEVGRRLRSVRTRLGMSLASVETRSGGQWSAAAIGAYERGSRAVTAGRLAALAAFYQVPLTDLLPDPGDTGAGFTAGWEACAEQVRAVLDKTGS